MIASVTAGFPGNSGWLNKVDRYLESKYIVLACLRGSYTG